MRKIEEKFKKRKVLKYDNHTHSNENEGEMVLFPFKRKKNQKLASIIAMIIGVLLMISTPIIKLGMGFTISGFVVGGIITLLGFVYFLDIL
ncbi:MAG: hypothetical protein NT076_03835 [Candidatus Pacearchaeota archaeon]|nr:hypothetical protein [Candidatus Pacearchaeota archaeon]